MPFTLRITFSGLCLFVPEAVPGGGTTGRMHVLMPGMSGHGHGHGHGHADRHVPALAYDAGSLVQNGPPLGVQAVARLTGHTLVFGAGDTASLRLCPQIPDLREITNQPVHPDHLANDTRNKLVSRVTLAAGEMTRVAPGVCWEWRPGEFRPIAHRAEWVISDVSGDWLDVVAIPLDGGAAAMELGRLYPRDGVLSLTVHHDTVENLPPDPLPQDQQPGLAPGDHAPHFAAYYGVFGEPVPMLLPRYWGKLTDCPPMVGGCEHLPPGLGGNAVTCVLAGVGGG